MRKLIAKFAREEDGAAMIEYTVLIGIITVAAIVLDMPEPANVRYQWVADLPAHGLLQP
jgi:hypothetical protein